MAYWWLLSFAEFVGAAKSGTFPQLVASSGKLIMHVPVVWLLKPGDMVERAFQIAFPSASAVAELCALFDVDAQAVRSDWVHWKTILGAQLTQCSPYRFRPVDLPELPG